MLNAFCVNITDNGNDEELLSGRTEPMGLL